MEFRSSKWAQKKFHKPTKIENEIFGKTYLKNNTLNRQNHKSFHWVANATLEKKPCHT
jgi:hypothetical protein